MSNVVPQLQPLGSRKLYETLFRDVFALGEAVSREDVRSYCLASQYRSGSQLNGALELLINIGALDVEGFNLKVTESFLQELRTQEVGVAVSGKLVKRLADAGEIQGLFPTGSFSWGKEDGELNVHLSRIPMHALPAIKLLRDLDTVLDVEETTAILRVQPPLAVLLQEALISEGGRKRNVKVLSPKQLERLQASQAEQGAKAEEYVLRMELNRLKGHGQINLVQQISAVNTAAGYDIESFEGHSSFLPDRFIEVKSHRGAERFFLSVGELGAAKELGDQYYLYLVDVDQYDSPEYSPVIIKNPAIELFQEDSHWLVTEVNFEVSKKKSQNEN